MPAIYSLWIVGRTGGLLYSRVGDEGMGTVLVLLWDCRVSSPPCRHTHCAMQDFLPLPPIEFNDKLRLASSW